MGWRPPPDEEAHGGGGGRQEESHGESGVPGDLGTPGKMRCGWTGNRSDFDSATSLVTLTPPVFVDVVGCIMTSPNRRPSPSSPCL